MADPGKFQYVLDGKGVTFVNSDDNKIKITGYAPEADVDETGVVYPTTGALSLSGKDTRVLGLITPPTASLTITESVPVFDAPIPVSVGSLSLSGKVPTLGGTVLPTTDSITFTGEQAARWTGLWLEYSTPTTVVAELREPATRAVSFASEAPDVSSSSATQITRVPPKVTVSLAGQAPLAAVANVTLPTLGTIAITGRLTAVNDFAYPGAASIGITGYVPDVIGEGAPTVIIEGPFEYGTFIRNTTATTDVPVNYQIDDRTGFKVKVKDVLIEEYTGHLVRPDSLDKRSEQEFLRSKSDGGKGPKRPEPVGNERHIDEEYPDGVSADDL